MTNLNWLRENGVPIVCQKVEMVNGVKKLTMEPNWPNTDYTNLVEQARTQGKNHIGINFSFIGHNSIQVNGGSLVCLDLDMKPLSDNFINDLISRLSKHSSELSFSKKGIHIFFIVRNMTPSEIKTIITKHYGKIKFKNDKNVGLDIFIDSGQVLLANEIDWSKIQTIDTEQLKSNIDIVMKVLDLQKNSKGDTHIVGKTDYKKLVSPGDTWAKLCNKNPILAAVDKGEWPGYNEVIEYKVPYIYYAMGKWDSFINLLQTKWPDHLKTWVNYFDKNETIAHAELIKRRLHAKVDWQVTPNKIALRQQAFQMLVDDLDLWYIGDMKVMWDGKKYNMNQDYIASEIKKWVLTNLNEEQLLSVSLRAIDTCVREMMMTIIPDKIWLNGENSAQKALIPLNNGVLNIHTKQFETSLRPKITQLIETNYNPQKTGEETKKFMTTIFGKYEPEIKKFIGSCLLRDLDKSLKKFFMVVVGKPHTGKSLFTSFMENLFGRTNISSLPLKAFDKDFSKPILVNKFANIANEMNFDDYASKEEVKNIVGRDTIIINEKFKPQYQTVITSSFIFLGNEDLNLSVSDQGIYERWFQYNLDNVHEGKSLKERFTADELHKMVPWNHGTEWKEDALVYALDGLKDYLDAANKNNDIPFNKDQDMIDQLNNISMNQSNLKDWWEYLEAGRTICKGVYDQCASGLSEFDTAMESGKWMGGDMNTSYLHWLSHQRGSKNHFNRNIKEFMKLKGWKCLVVTGNKKKYERVKI